MDNFGILEIIKKRRSVRRFSDLPVSDEMIEQVLEAGRWAPSGLNNQPWRFAVVTDRDLTASISKLTHYSEVVLSSRVLLPVFLNTEKSYHREKDIQAIGACIENMLLMAHSLGLGAVWLGEIIKSDKQIRQMLGLAGPLELMAVLAIGYPDEQPKPTKRKDLKELVVYEG